MTDGVRPEGRWPQWLKGLATIVVVLSLAAMLVYGNRERRLAEMSAAAGRVALAEQSPEALIEIDRATSPEIFYHVVLEHAPLGWPLQLRCEWQDPTGRTVFYNQYRTRFVSASMWPTHCRQRFQSTTIPGQWHVQLLSGSRVLNSTSFRVK